MTKVKRRIGKRDRNDKEHTRGSVRERPGGNKKGSPRRKKEMQLTLPREERVRAPAICLHSMRYMCSCTEAKGGRNDLTIHLKANPHLASGDRPDDNRICIFITNRFVLLNAWLDGAIDYTTTRLSNVLVISQIIHKTTILYLYNFRVYIKIFYSH